MDRKWGSFLQFTENEKSTVKLVFLKKGGSTSLQYHQNRSEQWFVIRGRILAVKGLESKIMIPGESIIMPPMTNHRLEGIDESLVLEVSRGEFSETDIVRLDQ